LCDYRGWGNYIDEMEVHDAPRKFKNIRGKLSEWKELSRRIKQIALEVGKKECKLEFDDWVELRRMPAGCLLELECYVCMEIVEKSKFQKTCGNKYHQICQNCIKMVDRCPMCRKNLI
jgi:hypothetical protein